MRIVRSCIIQQQRKFSLNPALCNILSNEKYTSGTSSFSQNNSFIHAISKLSLIQTLRVHPFSKVFRKNGPFHGFPSLSLSFPSSLQPTLSPIKSITHITSRAFHTESDFHTIADETLECIQEQLEEFFEQHFDEDDETQEFPEINVASGVLTLTLPPHGTWVLNKQTPNRQIWWSSPLSGPRRYEWEDGSKQWVYTRYVDELSTEKVSSQSAVESEWEGKKSLTDALVNEIRELYSLELKLDLDLQI